MVKLVRGSPTSKQAVRKVRTTQSFPGALVRLRFITKALGVDIQPPSPVQVWSPCLMRCEAFGAFQNFFISMLASNSH